MDSSSIYSNVRCEWKTNLKRCKPKFIKKFKAFLLVFLFAMSTKLLAQPLTPLNAPANYWQMTCNTGVVVAGNSYFGAAIGNTDSFWQVWDGGAWVQARIIQGPSLSSPPCQNASLNGGINRWITAPSLACPSNFGTCAPSSGLTFRRIINLTAADILLLQLDIWASDWVQNITVNGVVRWNSNVIPGAPNPPTNRVYPVKFNWCDWIVGQNIIQITVNANPSLLSQCRFVGMKVEAFDNYNYGFPYKLITGNTIACAGKPAVYTYPSVNAIGYAIGTSGTYSWTNPAGWGNIGAVNSPTHNVNVGNNSGLMSVQVYSTNPNGKVCMSVAALSITVPPPLTVTATPSIICLGKSSSLTAIGAGSYTWTAPGPTNISYQPSTVVSPTNALTTYTAKGLTLQGNCTYTKTVNLTVKGLPLLSITSSTSTICAGKNAWFIGSGAATYTWMTTPTVINPNLSVTPTVSTTYTLNGTGSNGCIKTLTVNLAVLPLPSVSVGVSQPVICAGGTSTLNASGAVNYSWSPVSSLSAVVVVSPNLTTTYSCTGTGANGCSKTQTAQVVALVKPVITAVPPAVCPGFSNTMTATGAANYTWYIGGANPTVISNTPVIVVNPTVSTTYTVCGTNSTNSCVACNTFTLNTGAPIGITAQNATLCTNAGNCINISANSAQPGVNFVWQPGTIPGGTIGVCPQVPTVYTVNATSPVAGQCPASATLAVSIASNCCSQPTAGLTVLTNPGGVYANTAFLLNSSTSLSLNTTLVNCEVWATEGVQLDIPPGLVLELDHTHLFACGVKMWQGIVVQDGGRIITSGKTSRLNNSMIEDAVVAVDLSNISQLNSSPLRPIDIQRVLFNRNFIGIKIANSDPNLSTLQLGITGCVFSSRFMPCTTWPIPMNAGSWQSSDMFPPSNQPGWNPNPGLRIATSSTAGLAPPYALNNFPLAFLKQPYNNQPAHIGIKIENFGDPNSFASSPGVEFATLNTTGGVSGDFNLFDCLGHGIDITDGSLTTNDNEFQNMQVYPSPGGPVGSSFGGVGIFHNITGTMNARLDLYITPNSPTGNRFFNCIRGIESYNVYDFWVHNASFRSTQSLQSALTPGWYGEYGILAETNRFNYAIEENEFNNLKYGIVCSTPQNPAPFDMTGSGSSLGIFADRINIFSNYFGAEVLSSTPYTGGLGSPVSEYMSEAIQLRTPNVTGWTNGGANVASITSNRIDRAYRGISIDGMEDWPLAVTGNSIFIEDDQAFGLAQYGVSAINNNGNLSVDGNTLQAQNSIINTSVSLVYCNNNYGTGSPHIHCNFLKNSYYGFQFDGPSPNAIWEGNQMCTHWAGLALTNGGVIGQQGTLPAPSNNYWAPIGLGCAPWGIGIAPNQTYCDPTSNPILSPIYGTALSGGLPVVGYVPTQNNIIQNGTFSYLLGTSIFTTNVNNPYNYDCWINNNYPGLPGWRIVAQTLEETGLNEDFQIENVLIYPNPSNGNITISSAGKEEILNVTISDLNGRLVYQNANVKSSGDVINVSNLASSVYIVEIKDNLKHTTRKKLIKTE